MASSSAVRGMERIGWIVCAKFVALGGIVGMAQITAKEIKEVKKLQERISHLERSYSKNESEHLADLILLRDKIMLNAKLRKELEVKNKKRGWGL